jgi:hypothetical protein
MARIVIDSSDYPLFIKDGLVVFDNDTIDLVEKIENLKLVNYPVLSEHHLECANWGMNIGNDEALQALKSHGIKVVQYSESPMINRKK